MGEASIRGAQSRAAGALFESIIEKGLDWYKERGWAFIEKTPEPMRPLSRPDADGRFLACFTKAAQPDFKGVLRGGQAIVFEAKHTDKDRIEQNRVTEAQAECLAGYHALGAEVFVVVSFGLKRFYRVPWSVWIDMKQIHGRKYMTPEDMAQCQIQYKRGTLLLLEGVEAKNYHI